MSIEQLHPERPYLFYDQAVSICSTCYRKAEGKIVFQEDKVFLLKRCPQHGWERVLMSDDVDYYRRSREVFLKAPEQPQRYNTPIRYGCPYDCGLCPDHEQHTCLTVLEITDACNLRCPVCYAGSGPERQSYRSLEQVEFMLDAVVQNEGEPDVVQISGGEPTIHPQFFEILDAAKQRPIRHLMVNTNGVRLAQERDFAERLARYVPGLELYLQFDSFEKEALEDLRAADLRRIHEQALDHCDEFNIPCSLVVTVKKGLNDHELGKIIDFALTRPSVRGVTFQPVQAAGRLDGYDAVADRLTLSEVRRKILEQTEVFQAEDLLPVPCHPDAIAMAYALKLDDEVVPLTGMIPLEALLEGARNTITYEKDKGLKESIFKLFSTAHSVESRGESLNQLLCCLPRVETPEDWGYDRVFRVIIMEFIDAQNFDLRSVKKTCVHMVHPDDGRLIPFDTYNLFYRDDLEEKILGPLRAELEPNRNFPPAPGSLPGQRLGAP